MEIPCQTRCSFALPCKQPSVLTDGRRLFFGTHVDEVPGSSIAPETDHSTYEYPPAYQG
jgi:hypothetical protein